MILYQLPIKSPWINPLEAHWVQGKRHLFEPERVLMAQEPEERICAHFHCPLEEYLVIPEMVS